MGNRSSHSEATGGLDDLLTSSHSRCERSQSVGCVPLIAVPSIDSAGTDLGPSSVGSKSYAF